MHLFGFAVDPWRYAVLAVGALALGVSLAALRNHWQVRSRELLLGISLLILAMILTTISHIGSDPVLGVYVEIAGSVIYIVGVWRDRHP